MEKKDLDYQIFVAETGSLDIFMKDKDLKFASTWELAHLPKSAESHLDQSEDFISGLTF